MSTEGLPLQLTEPLFASSPAKLILFGEWAVLSGHPGIATALSPRMNLTVSPAEKLSFDAGEAAAPSFFEFNRACIELLGLDGLCAELKWQREWKLCEGLGSSSATLATIAMAFFDESETADRSALWERLLPVLRAASGTQASGLDLAAQLLGGSVVLESGRVRRVELERPANLWLVHTGEKAVTPTELRSRKLDPGLMSEIGASARRFTQIHDYVSAIDEHYELLAQLGVVPQWVTEARETWISKGLVRTLKTTGAGGGDALLVWMNDPAAAQVLRVDVESRGWWISQAHWNAGAATHAIESGDHE
jgi:mevalonate kinase